jgi:hypothetical protein
MMSVIGGKAEISRVKLVRAEAFDQLGSTTHGRQSLHRRDLWAQSPVLNTAHQVA